MTESRRSDQTRLPIAFLAEEAQFAVEAQRWKEIEERLRAAAPDEACTFVLARPSRGGRRVTCLMREVVWPGQGDVTATPHNIDISADYISRAMDAAVEAGEQVGLVLIHTHPETEFGPGIGRFSPRDDWYESRLFPTITLGRPRALSGSIVLGTEPGSIDARLWWDTGSGAKTQPAEIVRIVGPEIRFLETPHSTWSDHPDPTMMDRSTRLWGVQGRRVLQNLRIGIVGAGGTGSVVLAAVATMGVGKIEVWDRDVVKKFNLHRMLGATAAMVGSNKATALAEWIRTVGTANPFAVAAYEDWATSADGLWGLKDCDIVFSCVDRFAPRVPLNDLAYAHLIPVIDMASWLHQTDGAVDAIMTHAHVWSPGIPCAWCRGTLSNERLMHEAQGTQRDAERRIPYGLPLDATDGVEPSVLALNLTGAGLALLQFMQVALRVTERTPRDLKLFLPEWELDESDLSTIPGCAAEEDTAGGDTVPIRPVPSATG